MNEKAGIAANQDYGRDEDAATKALRKHKVGEEEGRGRGRGSPRRGGGSEGKKVSRCIAVVYTYVAFFMADLDASRCSFISSA